MTDRDFTTLREDIANLRSEIISPLRSLQATAILHAGDIATLKHIETDVERIDTDVKLLQEQANTLKGMWLGAGAISGVVFAAVSALIQYFVNR